MNDVIKIEEASAHWCRLHISMIQSWAATTMGVGTQ